MEVGIIAPPKLLNKYCNKGVQYCLPKLLVENTDYRNFYREKYKCNGKIILDCRSPEGWKRVPEDLDIVKRAIYFLGDEIDIIILPSFTYKRKETRKVTESFLRELKSFTVAVCPEGPTFREFLGSYKELKALGPNLTAIPSYSIPVVGPRIKEFEGSIFIDNYQKVEEFDGIKNGTLVTSLPIRLGLEGRLLSDYLPTPQALTFNEDKDSFSKVTETNVRETLEFYK